jgi:glycosyltransferase involved in cell wall biosynthesis
MIEPPDPAHISAVIPTYNDLAHIGDALSSMVGQKVLPGEVVVCDDGSEDDTERFVAEFAARHADRVSVRYTKIPHSGLVAARNGAIAAARGEWIAMSDSDDTWLPTRLERQLEFLAQWGGRPIALLGAHGYNVNEANKVISRASMGPTTEEEYEAMRGQGAIFFMLQSSILFPRAQFEAVGGYSSEYEPAETGHFFCQMAERGPIITIPEPLVYYRKRSGSVQLKRFWENREALERMMHNRRRAISGQAPLDREEFARSLASAPAPKRLARRRRMWGMYYYRSGAMQVVNGRRVRGVLQLLLASLLDGTRLRSGVRNRLRGGQSSSSIVPPPVPAASSEAER